MIDVSRIRSIKRLREMKGDLNYFINKKIIADIYEERGIEPLVLEDERRKARELLTLIVERMEELNRQEEKPDSEPQEQETLEIPEEE